MNASRRWDVFLLSGAVVLAVVLGAANLAAPSLWHDELVHVFVARDIAATGTPHLPSGNFYLNGTFYNYVLAGVITILGDSEGVVRAPSVLFAAVNVVLTFLVLRELIGRAAALTAAFAMATCPWNVAWSREARFYVLQQTCYLAMVLCLWRAFLAERWRGVAAWTAGACASITLGLLTSYHSILYLAPVCVYAVITAIADRRLRTRAAAVSVVVCLAGLAAGACTVALFPSADNLAIFKEGGLGGTLISRDIDPGRASRMYYLRWLQDNLSEGYLFLALFGTIAMRFKEGRRGLLAALAFWCPFIVLTYLIGYRRDRFLFFAFPFYVAAFSYGLVTLARFLPTARTSWLRGLAALLIVGYGARLAVSTVRLWGDSIEMASGADTTLAKQHPKWREPCHYVRDHLVDGQVVICTVYLPALYYVGRCDQWYPSRALIWESYEVGHEGLKNVEELKAYLAEHPAGYFLADYRRFGYHPLLDEDEAWVEAHMTRIEEASNSDITVYAWGAASAQNETAHSSNG